MHHAETRGSIEFNRFLDENNITLQAAADALHVSNPTILDWKRGTKRPRAHFRSAIEDWTRGKVKAELWMTDEERGKLVVEPFAPENPKTD